MKALSVKQPFAALLCGGSKTIETRSWATEHRGELLICATATPRNYWWSDKAEGHEYLLHAGCMIGVVNLIDCRRMVKADEEAALSPFAKGQFAWVVEATGWCEPEPLKGQLGMFEVEDALIKRIKGARKWIYDFPAPQGALERKKSDPVLVTE